MFDLAKTLAAFLIITAPEGSWTPSFEQTEQIRPYLKYASEQLQIDNHSYFYDCADLRTRYHECLSLPPLSDAQRFGLSREYCCKVRELIIEDKMRLSDMIRIGLVNEPIANDWIEYLDDRYRIWDCLADAQSEYSSSYCKRIWLGTLRDCLGSEWYYSGHLPLP